MARAYAPATGSWLHEDRLARLHDRLLQMNTDSAQTWLTVLDHLARARTAEHGELAHQPRCTPEQLRTPNGKMSQLIRAEFTGFRWPFGWHKGRGDAGEEHGATIYEMHPRVADRWEAR